MARLGRSYPSNLKKTYRGKRGTVLVALLATEDADIAALNATIASAGIDVQLAATEAADAAAISAAATSTAQLTAIEAADASAINAGVVVNAQLTATESADTSAISGTVVAASITAQLAATEAADVAAIAVSALTWTLVNITAPNQTTATTHTLTLPTGIQQGDLLIATISSRIASSTPITLPSGGEWIELAQVNNDNVLTTNAALPTGLMAYCIRGASNPNTTFTHPVAPSVALGNIAAYRGVDTSAPLEVGSANTTGTNTLTATVGGFTTVTPGALIVAATMGGLAGGWSAFDAATDPSIASSGVTDTTSPPTENTWFRRGSNLSLTGADVSLGNSDAIKATPGATGGFSAVTTVASGHVMIVMAFKAADLGISVRLAATEAADTAAINATALQWQTVGIGAEVDVSTTSHALTMPAGVAAGDLLIAVISSRIASTTPVTLPTGGEWTLVTQQNTNNVVAGATTGVASGTMAYCVRGASDPNTTFTHPVAPNIAIGQIIAYRGVDTILPGDAASSTTTATNTTAISVTGITTTSAGSLIVVAACGARIASLTAFDATSPSVASGATDTTSAPLDDTWCERVDTNTAAFADCSLAIADAVKTTAGATGNITATASTGCGYAILIGSFKVAPLVAGVGVRLAATEVADASAIDADIVGTAQLAATEASDASAFTGSVFSVVSAQLAATEAGDTAAITAQGGIVVRLAAIEANDTAAISGGTVTWLAQLTAIEAADASAIDADIVGTARLAAIEANDTAAISGGTVTWLALLTATEVADASAIDADIVGTARLAATEAADISALNAGIVGAGVAATLQAQEAADASAISATLSGVAGSLIATEAADVAAVTASNAWSAGLVAIEAADTAALSGSTVWLARLAALEAADASAIDADIVGTAALAAIEANDAATVTGSVFSGIGGSLIATEAADASAITGAVTGTIVRVGATEAADASAITGAVQSVSTGSLIAIEAADTSAITGAVTGVIARLAATETNDTAAFAGLVQSIVTGSLVAIEAPDAAAIRALANAFGRLVAVEGADTAHFSSGRINQQSPGFIARQSPKPSFIARDDAPATVVARRNATNLIAGP